MYHEIFSVYLEHISYLGTFVLMALSGHLVPVPEEVILLLVGYASGIGLSNVYFTIIAAGLGVIAGDAALFYLSRTGNRYVERLKKKINPQKMEKYEKMMEAHAGKTIFLSRFIVGLRFFSPILAGMLKVKWRVFLISDILAIVIYVSGLIFLGYYFHSEIEKLITEVKVARHIIVILLISVIGLFFSYHVSRRFLKAVNGKNGNNSSGANNA